MSNEFFENKALSDKRKLERVKERFDSVFSESAKSLDLYEILAFAKEMQMILLDDEPEVNEADGEVDGLCEDKRLA